MTSRLWIGTDNNPPEDASEWVSRLSPEQLEKIKGAKWQLERAPETGRLHVQFLIRFINPVRLKQAKTILGDQRLHLEVCRAATAAVAYVSKEDSRVAGPFGYGDECTISQGERSDLKRLASDVRDGLSLREAAQSVPEMVVKFSRGLQCLRSLTVTARLRMQLRVIALVGATGLGKTRFVFDRFPDCYRVVNHQVPWYDGYDGQKVVLYDDYSGGMNRDLFLQHIDVYPCQVPVKGGHVPWNPELIFITSNSMPSAWYFGIYQEPILRRIHSTYQIVADFDFSTIVLP